MDLNARMDKIERRLDSTTKLIETGMKMLVKMQKEHREFQKEHREFQKETRYAINALVAAQMRTEVKLDRLISAMGRNGSNGHRN
jgi:uncharacterized membrane protein (DUF106 family)